MSTQSHSNASPSSTATTATNSTLFSHASRSSAFTHSPNLLPSPPNPFLPIMPATPGAESPGGLGDLSSVLSALQELHPGAARVRQESSTHTTTPTPRTLSPRPSRLNIGFLPRPLSPASSDGASTDSQAELSTVWSRNPIAAYLSPSNPSSPDHSEPSSPNTSSPSARLRALPAINDALQTFTRTHQHASTSTAAAAAAVEPSRDSLTPDSGEALGDFSSVLAYLHSQTSQLRRMAATDRAIPNSSPQTDDSESKRRALLDDLVRGASGVGVVVSGARAGSILDEDEDVDMEIFNESAPQRPAHAPTPKPPVKILLPSSSIKASTSSAPPPQPAGHSRKQSIPPLMAPPSLAPPARLMKLARKLMIEFPEEKDDLEGLMEETEGFKRAWGAQREASTRGRPSAHGQVHVFIDHSNILVGLLEWLKVNPPPPSHPSHPQHVSYAASSKSNKPLLSYPALALLLERGRPTTKRVLVASSPLYSSLEPVEACGYDVNVLKRVPQKARGRASVAATKAGGAPTTAAGVGSSPSAKVAIAASSRKKGIGKAQPSKAGDASSDTDIAGSPARPSSQHSRPPRYKEQAVDELLQLHIYKSILSVPPHAEANNKGGGRARNTLVLATGDAAGSEFNEEGFVGCARAAVNMGWKVEVLGWANGGVGRGWWRLVEELRAEAAEAARLKGRDGTGPGVGGYEEGVEERMKVVGLEEWGWELLE